MGNKSSTTHIRYTWTTQLLSPNTLTVATNYSNVSSYTDARVGNDNPRWRQSVKDGTSATNYMYAYRYSIDYHEGMCVTTVLPPYLMAGKQQINTGAALGLNSVVYPVKGIVAIDRDDSTYRASMQMRKKIKAFSQTYAGIPFLVELRKTLHLIKGPASTLMSLAIEYARAEKRLRKQLRGRVSSASSRRALASLWLEYSFGMVPLVGDITTIAEAALTQFDESRIKRVSADGTADSATSLSGSSIALGGQATTYYNIVESSNVTSKFTCGLRRQVESSDAGLKNLISKGGFNPSELASAAWELVPLSWLMDYFSNVNEVLSLTLISLADVAWTQNTLISVKTRKWAYTGTIVLKYPSVYTASYSPPSLETKCREVLRSTGSLDIPSLRFSLPGHRGQFLNLLAFATLAV